MSSLENEMYSRTLNKKSTVYYECSLLYLVVDFLAHVKQGVVTPIDSVQTPGTGVKNWVKQSKLKIWKVKRSKAHRKLEKVKGQAQ